MPAQVGDELVVVDRGVADVAEQSKVLWALDLHLGLAMAPAHTFGDRVGEL
jgi:hypothetical protein